VTERELLRRWVETWRRAGQELEQLRQRELDVIDTQAAIRALFETAAAVELPPAKPTSGLTEQQKYFARLRTSKPCR
jgi:hypothetical protein